MGTPLLNSGPVKQALINKLRANGAIDAAAVGGIHEGINARDTIEYPFITVSLAQGPYEFTFDSAMLHAGFDIVVRGPDPVKVNSLDALITAELNDSSLTVPEPNPEDPENPGDLVSLNLRREEELPLPPERNAMGRKIYQNGAFYSVDFDHPI
jgi:hypothetical protein